MPKAATAGLSMVPLLLPNDRLIVEKSSDYKVDDIIVFLKDGKFVAHRLVYINERDDYFITMGDNNPRGEKIFPRQILGKVNTIARNGREINLEHVYLAQSSNYLVAIRKINLALITSKISYLILKGLPVHIYFTGTPPKRIYKDFDILISEKDFSKAAEKLGELGFIRTEVIPSHTPNDKKYRKSTEISFVKPSSLFPIVIDLHIEPSIGFARARGLNKLFPGLSSFSGYLREGRKVRLVSGMKLPLLETSLFALYLMLHFYQHNFQGMFRLDFLYRVLSREDLDWGKLARLITKFQLENFTFPVLMFLGLYKGFNFPKSFLKKVKPTFDKVIVAKIIVRTVSPFRNDQRTLEKALKRLFWSFLLSPLALFEKLKLLLHPDVASYFLPSIKFLVFSSFKNSFKSFSAFL
ncbi:MAG: hypothetical protein UX88_C0001G0028 [Candidatus Woesebacteria bacterium GW2011_GWC2_47_16]|uniref:Peptidase S24/S26A/S26B/S26C domain-containing protein n=8 Tax=Candidatus Woeseibacteriota TaxID=1752722 RepID=A0A0G1QWR8_9BACT|nr:MAG: hypothetical protein UX03_C0003G0023 [Candidatus Woesebacteria bacterium GW2011_GWE1_45_18]KKU25159.1 MAG: hypothetical protein UX34_C0002G0022 [Candidatus Woesebacteria bacterium GW2011_GWF1_46_13]KKU49319.1 MAG: hypothetical protein UX67_C0002G0004 [Candidatus Woesebacteria bacterium GW2011_GWF2_46_8]KKU65368.1 MAG: hypothetical protein UX88_C0001G0028 [Candidatus Woesebacteria bacterium GW2011_GWC2_47_16]KKU71205.1 MAG: hypothetical protein UX95_C0002G0026 [Candidatus Woesebacteria b